jgi:hypothetical protein
MNRKPATKSRSRNKDPSIILVRDLLLMEIASLSTGALLDTTREVKCLESSSAKMALRILCKMGRASNRKI